MRFLRSDLVTKKKKNPEIPDAGRNASDHGRAGVASSARSVVPHGDRSLPASYTSGLAFTLLDGCANICDSPYADQSD